MLINILIYKNPYINQFINSIVANIWFMIISFLSIRFDLERQGLVMKYL